MPGEYVFERLQLPRAFAGSQRSLDCGVLKVSSLRTELSTAWEIAFHYRDIKVPYGWVRRCHPPPI